MANEEAKTKPEKRGKKFGFYFAIATSLLIAAAIIFTTFYSMRCITYLMKDYKETNRVISNFARETNSAEFAKHIKVTGDLKVKVDIENFVGSGTKIQIYKGDECLQTYICKLYGDVNGDGKISAVDYVKIKNHILKYKILTDDISCSVADVSNDNKISALYYVKIKNDILNVKKLELR